MSAARILIALCLTLAALGAHAQTTIGVHLVSYHINAPEKRNNLNPGAYVRNADGWVAGALYNSHERLSLYAGRDAEWGAIGVRVALITGYPAADVLPFLGVSLKLADHVRVSYVPPSSKSAALVHLSTEF